MTAPTERNPAAIETAGLEIAIQRQREGSADPSKREPTTAAGAVEKAAPIPAEVLALARETVAQVHEAEGNHHAAFRVREGYMDNRAPMLVALRLLADQVSQEERIRELEAEIEEMTTKFVAYEYLVSPAGEEIALEENARLRDRIAALEAEASEGERRGLEPTDAMVACFSDPMLNPEWVRSRLRAALALIPAPAREGE